jgi:hypothetical protein
MVATRRFVLSIFIPLASSSTMMIRTLDTPAASTRLFGCFSLAYYYKYSHRWWLTTFNVCACTRSLDITAQIKLWENLHWYFQSYSLVLSGCLRKDISLCHGGRKTLMILKICMFFTLYFILSSLKRAHVSLPCTVCF